jgi:hypothetical protein
MTIYHRGRRVPVVDAATHRRDCRLRNALTNFLVRTAREPRVDELSSLTGIRPAAIRKSLWRLESKRGLLLHPNERRPWIVHPFALAPTSCWVQGWQRGWWAPCLYCAFGISGCVGEDVEITTRFGGESSDVRYRISAGVLEPTQDVFHFLTPPSRWWDNVIFTCATFQPFASDPEVDRWCSRHGFERGYTISVERLFAFALDWYRPHADHWHPRSPAEIRECFSRHGLSGPFWNV